MTDRDAKKLTGCHPLLVQKLGLVLSAMDALGFPMMVTDGLRTIQEQAALFAQGRSAPGFIVTLNDGTTHPSNHQARDGFGRAADCCFVINGKPTWDGRLPWKAYIACVEAVGLIAGGSWSKLADMPHAELPAQIGLNA